MKEYDLKVKRWWKQYMDGKLGVHGNISKRHDIVMCVGSWVETTLRKNIKRICRDMFIAESHGKYEFGIVKNGRLVVRKPLTKEEKENMEGHYGLERLPSKIFRHGATYRTQQSNNLVKWLRE